jgi:hypothetical protein
VTSTLYAADLTNEQLQMCREPTGDCQFYLRCIEDQVQCGIHGYPQGYGFRYCEKFSAESHFSPRGEVWVEKTRQCLQESLLPYVTVTPDEHTCRQLMDDAFNSHPQCYTLPGSSICQLPIGDVRLICQTIQEQDLLSFRGMKQMAEVAKKCIVALENQLHLLESLENASTLQPPSFTLLNRLEEVTGALVLQDQSNNETQELLEFWRDLSKRE